MKNLLQIPEMLRRDPCANLTQKLPQAETSLFLFTGLAETAANTEWIVIPMRLIMLDALGFETNKERHRCESIEEVIAYINKWADVKSELGLRH